MKVSILCPYLSGNAFGRAFVLARLLQMQFEIEIIGPVDRTGIWLPLSQEDLPVRSVPIRSGMSNFKILSALEKLADGQILYASKPLLTSFGIGLLHNRHMKTPIVLDIDDWEIGYLHNLSFGQKVRRLLHPNFRRLDSYSPGTRYLFSKISLAHTRTVSSAFLQQKYGGTIIPHARDTAALDPHRYNSLMIKKELGLGNKEVVLFMGTPRPHKGLEDLAQAIRLLDRRNLFLVIVGMPPSHSLVPVLQNILGENLMILPMQPFREIPKFLAAADVVAIPQKEDEFTQAQVPAKLIDAMSMAKPVVASAVSDIPVMLNEGCGLLVEPGHIHQLASGIGWVLDHPQEAQEMGLKARAKCQSQYSYQVISPRLCQIFEQVIS